LSTSITYGTKIRTAHHRAIELRLLKC
jgi:hypothetical protein